MDEVQGRSRIIHLDPTHVFVPKAKAGTEKSFLRERDGLFQQVFKCLLKHRQKVFDAPKPLIDVADFSSYLKVEATLKATCA